MSELTRIDSQEIQEFYNEAYGKIKNIVSKSESKREERERIGSTELKEDDSSIYEYDYDCLRKSGFLDRLSKEK